MYLTYQEYQNMGGTLDETVFNNFEFQASTKIDWYTFNRLENEVNIPEKVKKCMFNLIMLLQEIANASGNDGINAGTGTDATVASYSNDGVSVSYNMLSAKEVIDTNDAKIEQVIKQGLQGVTNSLGHKLLYRGVYPDE